MTAALNAAPTTTVPRAIRNHLMSWPHCYLFGMGPAAVSRRYSRRLKVTPIAACTELLLPVTTLKKPIPPNDRMRWGEGKRVSGRVDPGDGRTIQKKKNK